VEEIEMGRACSAHNGKIVPMLNYAPRHKDILAGGDIMPHILDLGTRRR
jgi:hypothetical protein